MAGLWFGAWTVTAWGLRWNLTWLSVWVGTWFLLGTALMSFVRIKRIATSAFVALFSVSFVAGIALGAMRVWPILDNPVRAASAVGSIVRVQAVVDGDAVMRPDYVRIRARLEQITIHGSRFELRVPATLTATTASGKRVVAQLIPGQRIYVVGKLYPELPGRVSATGIRAVGDPQVISGAPLYQWLASSLRQGLHAALSGYWSDATQLVPGLTLGDISHVQPDLNSAMKSSGLSHLVAVSGTNVTLILSIVLALLRRRGASRVATIGSSLIVLAMFVIIVRPQPSVLRATTMGIIGLLAMYVGGRRTALPALFLAAITLLIIDPWLATSYGFALSVAATAGLVVWASKLILVLDDRIPRRVPTWFVEALAMTVAAQMAVLPLLISMGSDISLASIPANVIAAPLAGLVLLGGMAVALVAPIAPSLAHIIAGFPVLGAQIISLTARAGEQATFLRIPWPKGIVGMLCAVVSVIALLRWSTQWRSFHVAQRNMVAMFSATAVVLLWAQPLSPLLNQPPRDWVMMSCDVGQGDATILNVAPHQAVVVDVGGDPKAIDRCLTQVGVTDIPLLVLTHFHADHVGGLEGALRNRQIGQVRVTELQDPLITTQFALDVLRANQLQWEVVKFPQRLSVGSLSLSCLWPAREIRGQGSDANNASVAFIVEMYGMTALLAGDMEPPAQEAAIQNLAPMDFDVLKVPHHGSKYQSTDFAIWASPKFAVISSGKKNDYGHPAMSTIELYRSVGAEVLRTDQLGSIYVVKDSAGIHVVTQ